MINSRLRSIRKELSLTQENLARVLGIGKSALSMIETGKASLSERNKNILVQELNVNPDWLETGEGPMFLEVRPAAVFAGRSDRTLPSQSVPLYNIEGTAGLVPLFLDKRSLAATGRSTWSATACTRCSRAAISYFISR